MEVYMIQDGLLDGSYGDAYDPGDGGGSVQDPGITLDGSEIDPIAGGNQGGSLKVDQMDQMDVIPLEEMDHDPIW